MVKAVEGDGLVRGSTVCDRPARQSSGTPRKYRRKHRREVLRLTVVPSCEYRAIESEVRPLRRVDESPLDR